MILSASSTTHRRLRFALSCLIATATVALGLVVTGPTPAAAAVTNIFSDGFESGNSWSAYTNGTNQNQSIVSAPVHSGSAALQISAGTNAPGSDIGLADIKNFSFTESQSQLSFWYFASGGASFTNLTVEAYTAAGAEYYEPLPGAVVNGTWTQVKVMFSQISSSLTGASIAEFVIKADAQPNTGTAVFTIDDVSIDNGVVPPANLVAAAPAPGATAVGKARVLTAFYDAPLNPSSVSTSSVSLRDSANNAVAASVVYEAGQDAIAILPSAPLSASATYHVQINGVTAANGGGTQGDQAWSFTTGSVTGGAEQEFSDNLDTATGWSLYSSAPTQALGLVSAPVESAPTALQATATDSTGSFVVSAIRQTNWLDENSALNFAYELSGSATPQSLVVALTTQSGFTKFATYPISSSAATTWQSESLPVGTIDPGLVGQVIRQVELKVQTTGPGTIAFTVDDVGVTSNMDQYLSSVDAATVDSKATNLGASTISQIRALASQVEASQKPDGSIFVGPTNAGFGNGTTTSPYPDQKVDPYAANYAAMGLLHAYQVTGDSSDLTAANNWLVWYQNHLAPDGVDDDCVGYYPNCTDNGNQDSVDSYASTYLLASLESYRVRPSAGRASYLNATYPYVQIAAAALDSVYQQDGTTIAKPSYPARFGMDNAETFNGLVAESTWATADAKPAQATLARYLAARTLYSLRNRFDAAAYGHVANSVNPDGTADTSFTVWYPDALSSVLVLSHIGGSTTADVTLLNLAVTTFDTNDQSGRPTALTDTPQYMWWAQAALRVGEPSEAAHFVSEYQSIEGTHNPQTFAITAAHLIRVLAYPYNKNLWF
jgi:hypothetical protein